MSTRRLRSFFVPAAVFVAAVSFTTTLSAQAAGAGHGAGHGANHGAEESHEASGWKELDAFHGVMAAAWHPARNDSLAPARAMAGKLVEQAKLFAGSTAPKACDTPAIKAAVARLVPESEAVAALVARNAADAAIKAALKTVHDTFHVAEEGCTPAKPAR